MMGWDTMGLDVGFLGPLSWGQYQWHEEIGRCHLHMHKRRDLLLLEAAINHHSRDSASRCIQTQDSWH